MANLMANLNDHERKAALRPLLPWSATIAVDGRPGAAGEYVYFSHSGNRVTAIDPRRLMAEDMAAKTFYQRWVPLNQCPPGVRARFADAPGYDVWRREQGL